MKKTITSIIVMLVCAVVGLFVGSIVSDENVLGMIMLFVLVSGIACIIYTIETSHKD